MSPFKRRDIYYIDVRWRTYPRLYLSTDTRNKSRAKAIEHTLHALRSAGRRDLLGLLADRRLTLAEVHDAYTRDPASLEQLKAKAESPCLGDLVDRWLEWLRSPAGISPRTRRRYSPKTIAQYAGSWEGFFSVLPLGRSARLTDLTQGFVFDYRRTRVRAVGGRCRQEVPGKPLSPATFNRDIAALGAFLTWAREVEGLDVPKLRLRREREPQGRERWLSADELTRFEAQCPAEWWPFFAVLFYTGARLGEVQGLCGGDVLLHAHRLTVHEGERRVKSRHAVRDLPIPAPLERVLAAHLARAGLGPADLVFPGPFQRYKAVRRAWDAVCKAADIDDATPHDARHTFGVHAAQAGVPIVRLQKLLGHATPHMTLRYMQHAPEAFMSQDGEAIAASMTGATDREREARAEAARAGMRTA